MSDSPSDNKYQYVPEPDESVLMAALRNQDDIPILMDVVGENLPQRTSQEQYLTSAMTREADKSSDQKSTIQTSERHTVSPDLLHAAIEKALQRMLPQLADEVLKELKNLAAETPRTEKKV